MDDERLPLTYTRDGEKIEIGKVVIDVTSGTGIALLNEEGLKLFNFSETSYSIREYKPS